MTNGNAAIAGASLALVAIALKRLSSPALADYDAISFWGAAALIGALIGMGVAAAGRAWSKR